MDTDLLVDDRIDDGQRLIDQLTREEFEVLAAFWIRASEDGLWQLYIASPSIDPEKLGEAYRQVYAALRKLEPSSVSPSDLDLINGANPVARAVIEVRDRYPGKPPTRYHGKRLGNFSIEEAYIYPPAGKWFEGFDEIEKNFPSAEVFTMPVLFEDIHSAKSTPCLGATNAETFEGRRPGTVLFMGPKGSSRQPVAELYFVYRPEGWNTLYRADTQRYEEVCHVGTGEPLYRSADYSVLAALKTQKKPGEDQIERIKAGMRPGDYITRPPDETPIPTPVDWESLRAHIQCGGRIELHSPAKKETA